MLKYKLTTQDNKTRLGKHNETLWGPGVTHEKDGKGDLCGPGWLHYYHWPEMAVLMNPIHANIPNPKLWECEAEGLHKDDFGLKGGCTKLTTIREIPLPKFTKNQHIVFNILCAKEVCDHKKWNDWADRWLSGEDRSEETSKSTYDSLYDIWEKAYHFLFNDSLSPGMYALYMTLSESQERNVSKHYLHYKAARGVESAIRTKLFDFDKIIKETMSWKDPNEEQ